MDTNILTPILGKLNIVHDDNRRTICEFNSNDFSVQSFRVKEKIPLGNHFHKRKSEIFIITKGGGTFAFSPVDEYGQLPDKMKIVNVEPGAVIFVPVLVAHAFLLHSGSEMVCFSSARYDKNDEDVFPCKLME